MNNLVKKLQETKNEEIRNAQNLLAKGNEEKLAQFVELGHPNRDSKEKPARR